MKQKLRHAALAGLGGLVAGCAPTQPQEQVAPVCLAESYQGLIGGSEEEALDTLADLFLLGDDPPDVRYIGPGDVVTMDFRPDRMNIELDAADRVTRVYCG